MFDSVLPATPHHDNFVTSYEEPVIIPGWVTGTWYQVPGRTGRPGSKNNVATRYRYRLPVDTLTIVLLGTGSSQFTLVCLFQTIVPFLYTLLISV